MAASSWSNRLAVCLWALSVLLALGSCEQQSSELQAHRQTLLETTQQQAEAPTQPQYFSKEFPHGSGVDLHID